MHAVVFMKSSFLAKVMPFNLPEHLEANDNFHSRHNQNKATYYIFEALLKAGLENVGNSLCKS